MGQQMRLPPHPPPPQPGDMSARALQGPQRRVGFQGPPGPGPPGVHMPMLGHGLQSPPRGRGLLGGPLGVRRITVGPESGGSQGPAEEGRGGDARGGVHSTGFLLALGMDLETRPGGCA